MCFVWNHTVLEALKALFRKRATITRSVKQLHIHAEKLYSSIAGFENTKGVVSCCVSQIRINFSFNDANNQSIKRN